MWPALLGAGLGMLGNFLGSPKGGAGGSTGNAAQYLNQIAPMGKEIYNPYIKRGHEAQNLANGKYNEMAANPMDYINQIISGYKPSEGYKFKEQKALEAARNNAAAGGLTGTRNDQLQQAEMANGLLGGDMQEWLQNVLGVQGAGLTGQQHVADTGLHASNSLADLLGGALNTQADLAYEDQKEKRANRQKMFGDITGFASMGLGGLGSMMKGSTTPGIDKLGDILSGIGIGINKGYGGFNRGTNSTSERSRGFRGSVYGQGRG